MNFGLRPSVDEVWEIELWPWRGRARLVIMK
jgi:hypothetical protein